MDDDVIEFSLGRRELQNVLVAEFDVLQAGHRQGLQAGINLDLGRIDSQETGPGHQVGHGQQIRPVRAAQLENPSG